MKLSRATGSVRRGISVTVGVLMARKLRAAGPAFHGVRRPPSRSFDVVDRSVRGVTRPPLVSPPVAPALDVLPRRLTEVGRADDDDLEALRPGLVASPRAGRDAHRVPLPELDDLVVPLHPPAPAQDHVHLLLRLVRVAVRKAIAGRDALVAEAGPLELERLGRRAELQIGRTVEPRAEVLEIRPDVRERERHGANPMAQTRSRTGSPQVPTRRPPRRP